MLRREIPIMILVSVFAYALTLDGQIGRADGIILLLGFVGFNAVFYVLAKREADTRIDFCQTSRTSRLARISRGKEIAYLIAGIIALVLGSRMMVEGAVSLARAVGISELIIAITLVAFGTSLPELAASLSAAWHRETDIAIWQRCRLQYCQPVACPGRDRLVAADSGSALRSTDRIHHNDRICGTSDTLHVQATAGSQAFGVLSRLLLRLHCV